MDDQITTLLALETLRSNPSYYQAEVLRRNTPGGAGAMASAPANSKERQAVNLLIGTWEVIAVLLSGLKRKDKIFEVTPICHMYRELKDAIGILGKGVPGLGSNFAKLNREYETWLKRKKKTAKYIGEACDGLFAKFG